MNLGLPCQVTKIIKLNMNCRKTQKAYSLLPKDYTLSAREVFNEKFSENLYFFISGQIHGDELVYRVGFKKSEDSLKQVNFDFSLDLNNENPETVHESLKLALNLAGAHIEAYINNKASDEDYPVEWYEVLDLPEDHPKAQKVYMKIDFTNTELEDKANELLGERDTNLIKGEFDSEDLIKTIETLN